MRTATIRTIAGRVNANGTIATGSEFTVNKAATGAYTITVNPGLRLVSAVASFISSGGFVGTDQWGPNSFRVLTYSAASVLTDIPFTLILTVAS